LQVLGDLACLDSEKDEALIDNIESQFQPVLVSLMQMNNIEQVRETIESFALAPIS
jgi:hypothetical protein